MSPNRSLWGVKGSYMFLENCAMLPSCNKSPADWDSRNDNLSDNEDITTVPQMISISRLIKIKNSNGGFNTERIVDGKSGAPGSWSNSNDAFAVVPWAPNPSGPPEFELG
ncbi:hypothetical protein PAAG_02148 [Paracoccidioides lutzii Pb01]|uniref:Uncharacterized protein n=1 Tax=Paracoccidioides lutzii (strain ATCC MYA-826 / Pb01) TaxID=502779 RepID=C1GUF3_PARBA|nr:hypothetical protein PAAG_02148 [Paracoccidioides lutzii Pb01]EEH39959.1 hypothetical protein PAAG_02148 [Paracoccidioides lutzii Pb01]